MRTKLAVLLASALGFGLAQSASAADIPTKAPARAPAVVAPATNWTGFYLGIDGGFGWGTHDRQVLPAGFANSYDSDGGLIGGHIGYNWQFNQFLIGVEGDAHWADIRGNDAGAGGTTDETQVRFLASIRGRVGLVWNNFLIFGTGGWSFANINHHNIGGVPVDNSADLDGPTAGGGFQWAINPNWSVGAEYRHYWLGDYTFDPVGLAPFRVDNNVSTVTARITYRFGGP